MFVNFKQIKYIDIYTRGDKFIT